MNMNIKHGCRGSGFKTYLTKRGEQWTESGDIINCFKAAI